MITAPALRSCCTTKASAFGTGASTSASDPAVVSIEDVGLATAVLLDATVVRGILLPATLTLLGERAHHGPRWIPQIHH